jgi:hypothetical protein
MGLLKNRDQNRPPCSKCNTEPATKSLVFWHEFDMWVLKRGNVYCSNCAMIVAADWNK